MKKLACLGGFSLLEIMLALIVVSIGVAIILSFSASHQQETSSQARGNDYGVITNHILDQFISDVTACNGSVASTCPLNTLFQDMNAYDYLCGNPMGTTSVTHPPASNNAPCQNGKLDYTKYNALKNAGMDLMLLTLSLSSHPSD